MFHLNKKYLLGGVFLWCTAFFSVDATIRLLIIDSQGKDAYYYRNLIELCQRAGFTVSYRSFHDFLEHPSIDNCDALIYMLTPLSRKKVPHCQKYLWDSTSQAISGLIQSTIPLKIFLS